MSGFHHTSVYDDSNNTPYVARNGICSIYQGCRIYGAVLQGCITIEIFYHGAVHHLSSLELSGCNPAQQTRDVWCTT